jgi:hypothetical protein
MRDVFPYQETSQSALKALLYYDIFQYPLTSKEVFHFMSTNHVTQEEVTQTLDDLSAKGYIFQQDQFYSVRNSKEIIARRVKGNNEAAKWIHPAEKQARLIYSFPFVQAVMVSGSLSKNYMDDKSDLDFFIITSPGRLWVARTLLVLYKKIILSNSHKHFCVNYFIDSDHLEIDEKNIFTATELATLLPLCGNEYYNDLFKQNRWLKDFLPNHHLRPVDTGTPPQNNLKKTLEKVIDILGGTVWDTLLMHLTNKRWRRIYSKHYSREDFTIAFKTKKYASKNHPNFYQKKVVNQYLDKLTQFAHKFNIQWIHE